MALDANPHYHKQLAWDTTALSQNVFQSDQALKLLLVFNKNGVSIFISCPGISGVGR